MPEIVADSPSPWCCHLFPPILTCSSRMESSHFNDLVLIHRPLAAQTTHNRQATDPVIEH